jgi:dihydropteroate synthase
VSESATRGALRLRERSLVWGARTYIMGIVNVSPDSFSGDGATDTAAAVARAREQRDAECDLIDIGGESTRPGYEPIDAATEIGRLVPVIEALRSSDERSIVSVDTFKADVYRRANAAGGDLLNSIWGASDALIEVCVETNSPIVVMHNKAVAIYEGDVVDEVLASLASAAERCVRAGIPAEHVILDPGIGFGKTPEHNISMLGALPRLVALGFPTLLGTSRKSTIGRLTARDIDARAFGTAATVALAAAAGIDIVRVHDVSEQRDVVHVTDAIVRGWRPPGWTDVLR